MAAQRQTNARVEPGPRRLGVTVARHLLFWLLALFAVGETSQATDQPFVSAQQHTGAGARQASSAAVAVDRIDDIAQISGELASHRKATLTGFMGETGDKSLRIPRNTDAVTGVGNRSSAPLPTTAGLRTLPLGFRSQAPPVLG
jgi:hypothetical protein